MTQTASGPIPSNTVQYYDDLDAIAGMVRVQELYGISSKSALYSVETGTNAWTVTFPDGVDAAAVDHVVSTGA